MSAKAKKTGNLARPAPDKAKKDGPRAKKPAEKVAEKDTKKEPQPAAPKKEPTPPPPKAKVEPAPEKIDSYYDYGEDSSSDEDSGPPPVMQIGDRTTDIGSLHKTFAEMKDRHAAVEREEIVERLGKDMLTNIASSFEQGGPKQQVDDDEVQQQERHKLIHIEKEKYDSFKNKFEHITEEMNKSDAEKAAANRRSNAEDITLGKDKLDEAKLRFEGKISDEPVDATDKVIDVHRSEEDKQRIKKTFVKAQKKEEPQECAICGKTVFFAERLPLEGRVYHHKCFRCSKCGHGLSVQNYHTYEGQLYCKVHILDFIKPGMNPEHWAEAPVDDLPDEEEDYATVSRPKVLDPNIVRSGLKTTDDLGQVPNLRSVKNKWESSAEEASHNIKLRTEIENDVLEPGKVKARMSKFIDGDGNEQEVEEEEDNENRDPNIIRENKKKKKELPTVNVEVGSIKSKWETGTMETAGSELEDRSTELEEIKKSGVPVRDRFKEGQASDTLDRTSILQQEGIDFTASGATRERFKTGELFQSGPVERTTQDTIDFKELGSVKDRFERGSSADSQDGNKREVVDVRCEELGSIKAAFESGPRADEDSDQKQQAISEEFQQFKKERRLQLERERNEREAAATQDGGAQPAPDTSDDIRQCAELSNIKQRFEEGTAFKVEEPAVGGKELDSNLEYKVAGKAREKFKQIDHDHPAVPMQTPNAKESSKWATPDRADAPEPVNKRVITEDEYNEPEDFELKNIISKFKTLEMGNNEEPAAGPKEVKRITPPPGEYRVEFESQAAERDPSVVTADVDTKEVVSVDARNLKNQFEQLATKTEDQDEPEEHKKRLEEEFRLYKELKEKEKLEAPEEPVAAPVEKEDVQIAAEHAAKMKQKWEKIQKKEAKKAQKAAMRRPSHGMVDWSKDVPAVS